MITRCKFLLESKQEVMGGAWNLKFRAVTQGSDENKEFWRWTPTGTIEFNTVNAESAKSFNVGSEYHFDVYATIQVKESIEKL